MLNWFNSYLREPRVIEGREVGHASDGQPPTEHTTAGTDNGTVTEGNYFDIPAWQRQLEQAEPLDIPLRPPDAISSSDHSYNSNVSSSTNASSADDSHFRHAPMDLTKQTIRIFKIRGGSGSEPIHCKLRHTTDFSKHTALSYMWGPDTPTKEIYINGQPFAVRMNLYQFLHRMRDRNEDRIFWVDAICLDQDNTHEKNHQVRHMGEIYQKAKNVFVWLGDGGEQQYALERLARGTARIYQAMGTHSERFYASGRGFEVLGIANDRDQRRMESSLVAMCNNEYWGRTWIVQEVLLSLSDARMVLCGPCRVPWTVIKAFLASIGVLELVGPLHRGQSPSMDLRKSPAAKLFSRNSNRQPLVKLLDDFGTTHCSDVRDRIFALRSLLELPETIRVDYGADKVSLYHHLLWCETRMDYRPLLNRRLLSALEIREGLVPDIKAMAPEVVLPPCPCESCRTSRYGHLARF
jgi:hypothetical protein